MHTAAPKIKMFNKLTPFGRKIIWLPYMPMILKPVIDKNNFPHLI